MAKEKTSDIRGCHAPMLQRASSKGRPNCFAGCAFGCMHDERAQMRQRTRYVAAYQFFLSEHFIYRCNYVLLPLLVEGSLFGGEAWSRNGVRMGGEDACSECVWDVSNLPCIAYETVANLLFSGMQA